MVYSLEYHRIAIVFSAGLHQHVCNGNDSEKLKAAGGSGKKD